MSTRRTFLKGTLRAVTGLLLLGCACAPAPHSVRWALVSDIHMDVSTETVMHDQNLSGNFRRVADEIIADRDGLAGVIIDGDLALSRGASGAYTTLARLLEPFRQAKIDVHLILGNHDDRDNFFDGLYGSDRPDAVVPGKYCRFVDSGPVRLFLLDSNIRANYTPGELGPEQLHWLAEALDDRPDKPAILFLHHPPGQRDGLLSDTDALMDVIRPRHQVKAIFIGHAHVYAFYREEGIHLVWLPPTAYVFRDTDPLGWVSAQFSADGCELELHAIGGDQSQDGRRKKLRWRD